VGQIQSCLHRENAALCGNYAIFNASNDFYPLYGVYYLGFLLLGVWESIEKIETYKRDE
jgi:hypothetical protein